MQCECRKNLEAKLREHVTAQLPEGHQDYDARIEGYGFAMNPETLTPTSALMIPYRGDVMVPKKTGAGMKRQKIDTSVKARFCPFCGQPADAEEA